MSHRSVCPKQTKTAIETTSSILESDTIQSYYENCIFEACT